MLQILSLSKTNMKQQQQCPETFQESGRGGTDNSLSIPPSLCPNTLNRPNEVCCYKMMVAFKPQFQDKQTQWQRQTCKIK